MPLNQGQLRQVRQTPEVPPPVGQPFAWWPMLGETDVLRYGYGDINGPTVVEDDQYLGGYAYNFDGEDDHVLTTNWGTFGSSMFSGCSILFTITADTFPSDATVMGNRNNSNGWFQIRETDGEFMFYIRDSDDESMAVKDSNHPFPSDNPVRYACVHSGGATTDTMEMWRNGNDVNADTRADDWTATTTEDFDVSVAFGAQTNTSNTSIRRYWDGIIDDVVIYDYPLSDAEIKADLERQPWWSQ